MLVLIDVANVVGSRPDGWWLDRAGATSRLLDRLSGVTAVEFVAVVEGRARDVPEVAGVRLVRAPGSGDDALAAEARELSDPVVVTADRGLRARLPAGATVHGPGWLLDLLDQARDRSGGSVVRPR